MNKVYTAQKRQWTTTMKLIVLYQLYVGTSLECKLRTTVRNRTIIILSTRWTKKKKNIEVYYKRTMRFWIYLFNKNDWKFAKINVEIE